MAYEKPETGLAGLVSQPHMNFRRSPQPCVMIELPPETAENNANTLTLGVRVLSITQAEEAHRRWLAFAGGRQIRLIRRT
jgi:hypothetical protein